MNIDINKLTQDINELKRYFAEKEYVAPIKPLEDEVNEEMNTPQYNQQKQDAKFLVKSFKWQTPQKPLQVTM